MAKSTIFDVLEYGPIVAADEELGVLITVNGSYYNIWVGYDGMYNNTDAHSVGVDVYGKAKFGAVVKAAEKILEEIRGNVDEDE